MNKNKINLLLIFIILTSSLLLIIPINKANATTTYIDDTESPTINTYINNSSKINDTRNIGLITMINGGHMLSTLDYPLLCTNINTSLGAISSCQEKLNVYNLGIANGFPLRYTFSGLQSITVINQFQTLIDQASTFYAAFSITNVWTALYTLNYFYVANDSLQFYTNSTINTFTFNGVKNVQMVVLYPTSFNVFIPSSFAGFDSVKYNGTSINHIWSPATGILTFNGGSGVYEIDFICIVNCHSPVIINVNTGGDTLINSIINQIVTFVVSVAPDLIIIGMFLFIFISLGIKSTRVLMIIMDIIVVFLTVFPMSGLQMNMFVGAITVAFSIVVMAIVKT